MRQFCQSHSISQEPYIKWFPFMVHICVKWCRFCFLSFKNCIFGVARRVKGQKMTQLTHCISQEQYHLVWFLVHTCKMISPAIFFLFLQSSDFSGFSILIKKCKQEILRCALASSDVCGFNINILIFSTLISMFPNVYFDTKALEVTLKWLLKNGCQRKYINFASWAKSTKLYLLLFWYKSYTESSFFYSWQEVLPS